jgi:hypothetical protein
MQITDRYCSRRPHQAPYLPYYLWKVSLEPEARTNSLFATKSAQRNADDPDFFDAFWGTLFLLSSPGFAEQSLPTLGFSLALGLFLTLLPNFGISQMQGNYRASSITIVAGKIVKKFFRSTKFHQVNISAIHGLPACRNGLWTLTALRAATLQPFCLLQTR